MINRKHEKFIELFNQIEISFLVQQNFKTNYFKRALGCPIIQFKNKSVKELLGNKDLILSEIDKNGCICLKNVDLSPKQMVEFTKELWTDLIQLPSFLAFNNQDHIYKQVVRVGNVQVDGTLKDSSKEAFYWHQDGDFWGSQRKHIFNCLHTKQIPKVGGETLIMDLVEGAKFLKSQKPKIYKKLHNLIGQLSIDEIPDFKLANQEQLTKFEPQTLHQLINQFNRHGYQEVLFLSVFNLLDKQSQKRNQDIKIEQIYDVLQNQMGIYRHTWEQGDMLIWDNLQVMHRSSGAFTGRRLLLRTQGRSPAESNC